MNAVRKLLTVVVLLVVAATASANMVVDDLISGPVEFSTPSNTLGTWTGSVAASTVWGGVRDWSVTVFQTAVGGRARVYVDTGGVGGLDNSSSVRSDLTFEYGSFTSAGPQGADWQAISGLLVTVMSLSETGSLYATIDAGGTVYTSIANAQTVDHTGDYIIPFGDFSGGPMNLAQVDGVSYTFSGNVRGFDVDFTFLGLTPEPTTMVVLGAGLLALARRRRKKA